MNTQERISQLRTMMRENGIDAFIVFSADPHLSEYLPEEWQERTWISNFSGSAGFVVFTQDKAGLWTDGRYFTQAETQLKDTGIELMKDGVEGTPNYIDWLVSELKNGGKVAVNALATSHTNWVQIASKLEKEGIRLVHLPLMDSLWTDRPQASTNEIFTQPVERAGKSVEQKLTDIRAKLKQQNATAHIIASLDDVAWTLNLRGSDVEANPVFLSYIYLIDTEAVLFVGENKLNEEAQNQLQNANVKTLPYSQFFDFLSQVEGQNILISPNTNQMVFDSLQQKNTIIEGAVPGNLMKAQKNATELQGFRTAMEKDGVAMVNFLYWLTQNVGKEPMTEYSIGKKLKSFRAEQENFVGESFGSIVGYKGNGAIIHYSAKEKNCKEVTNSGTILIDSGGQYLEGTTDITRTLSLGTDVSEDFKQSYTLVLKGMINLSMAKFPKGTRGVQLDTLARQALWKVGKDYAHGTGHGVGSFMNVHEGPQNIRKDMNPQELLIGMVCSNEPGFYVVGEYGIRIENLIAVTEAETTDYGEFYKFETLTICPIAKDIIIKELLSSEEIEWLNNYHRFCEEKLAKHLSGEVKDWFLQQVSPL